MKGKLFTIQGTPKEIMAQLKAMTEIQFEYAKAIALIQERSRYN